MNQSFLILPELLTVAPQITEGLRLPALERLLSKGVESVITERCAEQSLLRYTGYVMPDVFSVPAARLCWQADFREETPDILICADPVHMLADKSQARLMDATALKLSEGEANQLLAALNRTFGEDGLEFKKGSANRWYLSGMDSNALRTLPVKNLVGRNVANFLPEGPKLADWRRLTTEIQMLLFAHPVNQARAGQGQLPVNALWFWGNGAIPPQSNPRRIRLFGDDIFSRALAQESSNEFVLLHEFSSQFDSPQDFLLLDNRGQDAVLYDDFAAWRDWVMQLETTVFAPVLKSLRDGRIDQLLINTGNGREFEIGKSGWRSFFRRDKSLSQLVSAQTVDPLGL